MLPQCLLSDVEGSHIRFDPNVGLAILSSSVKLGTKRYVACYDVSFVPLCVIIIIVVVVVVMIVVVWFIVKQKNTYTYTDNIRDFSRTRPHSVDSVMMPRNTPRTAKSRVWDGYEGRSK